jgi:hypothetical protein
MAELADALALGASSREAVQVQLLFRAPKCSGSVVFLRKTLQHLATDTFRHRIESAACGRGPERASTPPRGLGSGGETHGGSTPPFRTMLSLQQLPPESHRCPVTNHLTLVAPGLRIVAGLYPGGR